MLRVIGADPGASGALAFICGGDVLDVIDVPVMPDNSQIQVDGLKLCRWIDKYLPIDLAVLENVQPMRGFGADSEPMPAGNSFRFGLICGQFRMAFQAYGMELRLVTPSTWKRHFGLLGKRKEDSRQKAFQIAPEARRWLLRKGDHNRAEAILIGLYGAEKRGML